MAIAPSLIFQIQRDREEEMIHRECSTRGRLRSIFRKFGRYPHQPQRSGEYQQSALPAQALQGSITGKDFNTSPLQRSANDEHGRRNRGRDAGLRHGLEWECRDRTQTAGRVFQPGARRNTNADRTGSNDRQESAPGDPTRIRIRPGDQKRIEQPLGLGLRL